MMAAGDAANVNVGTLTADFKVNASTGMQQIGTIMQSAEQMKNAFGNVTFKIDMGNSPQAVQDMAASVIALKNAQAQQALATAAVRAAQEQGALAMANVRQQQALMAEATRLQNDLNNTARQTHNNVAGSIDQQRLAAAGLVTQQRASTAATQAQMEAQKLASQATLQAVAAQQALTSATNKDALEQQRLATAALATQQKDLAAQTQAVRLQQAQLALQHQQTSAATSDNSQSLKGYIDNLKQGVLFGAAFRAGELLLQDALQGTKQLLEDLVKSGMNWQTTLTEVQNNTTQSTADNQAMDASIRTMAANSNGNMGQMAQGYRHLTSEGENAAQAQGVLNEAMMSALSTGSNQEQTINLLGQTLHIFGADTNEAAGYMNVLHLSAALGNTTLQEFVETGGRAIATAASLGVSLVDVGSAMSALTRQGYSVQQASTMLVAIMKGIANPTKEARDEIEKLSAATGIDLVYDFSSAGLATKGLTTILNDARAATGGNNEELLKILPNVRGGLGEVVLLGQGWQDYNDILKANAATMAGETNPTLDAYNRTVNTTAFQVGVLKNEFQLFVLDISEKVMPIIKTLTEGFQSLLQAMGVDFKVPGFEQFSQQQQALAAKGTSLAGKGVTGGGPYGNGTLGTTNAGEQAALDQIQSSKDLAIAQGNLAIADQHLRDLATENTPNLNALTDAKTAITNLHAQYDPLITNGEDTIRRINTPNPDDIQRTLTASALKQQEIQIKLRKPDTSDLDKSIADTKAKLDNLAEADTTAVDARITSLQEKIKSLGTAATDQIDQQIIDLKGKLTGLGNTTALDRQIQDLQKLLNKPDQSTSAQQSGMTTLEGQLAAGQISQSAFASQFGNLSRQKQAIVDNNTTARTALQQQIYDLQTLQTEQKRGNEDQKAALDKEMSGLDLKKQQLELNNRIQVEGLQTQLTAAQNERKNIIDTHDDQVKSWNAQIKQWDLEKTNRLAQYTSDLAANTAAQERNQLLIDAAKTQREIVTLPIQAQVDKWKNSLNEGLIPLNQTKDFYQNLVDLNTEDTRGWQDKKREATSTIESIKASIAAAKLPGPGDQLPEPPAGLPTSTPLGGLIPDKGEPKYGQEHFDASAAQRADPMTLWIDNLNTKIRDFGVYLVKNLPDIIKTVQDTVSIDVSRFFKGVDAARNIISLIADFNDGNWAAVRQDLTAISHDLGGNASATAGATNELQGAFGSGTGGQRPTPPGQIPGPFNTDNGGIVIGDPSFTQPPVTIGGKVPAEWVNEWMDAWLKKHGLGALTSFGGGSASAADLGGKQADVDAFMQHIQDTLGDSGQAPQAIAAFVKQLTDEFAQNGDIDKSLKDAEDSFTTTYGTGGVSQQAMQQFGEYARGVFGQGGRIDQYVGSGGTVSQTLTDMQQAFQRNFDANGNLRDPVNGWTTFMNTTLGTGGTIAGFIGTGGDMSVTIGQLQQLLNLQLGTTGTGAQKPVGDFVDRLGKAFGSGGNSDQLLGVGGSYSKTLTVADTKTTDVFGTGGTTATAMQQYVTAMETIFKSGGSVALAMGDFGSVMDTGLQPGIDAINSFMNALAGAIKMVGGWFGDTTLSGIVWNNIGLGNPSSDALKSALNGSRHASGLSGGMPGHWAMIGERGPEAMYVPPNATIIPNHLLPGHADGLLGPGLAAPTLPSLALLGALAGTGTSFSTRAQSDLNALVARLTSAGQTSAAGGGGTFGSSDIPLVNIIRAATNNREVQEAMIMGALVETGTLTAPWPAGFNPDWQGPFQMSMSARGVTAQQANDPQFAVAAMLGDYTRAVAGHQPWKETADFIASVITDAEVSVGYNEANVQSAFAKMEALFAAPSNVGVANVEGMSGDQLIRIAQSDLVGKFGWCEQYVGDVMQAAGLRYARSGSAQIHSGLQPLNSGRGPLGAITFFPDSSGDGHVAFSLGNNRDVWGTIAGGRDSSQVGVLNTAGWEPYGWTDNPRYNGGFITEPTLTLGMYSGKRGTLAERGVEQIIPNYRIPAQQKAGSSLNINGGVTIVAQPGRERDVWSELEKEAARRGMRR